MTDEIDNDGAFEGDDFLTEGGFDLFGLIEEDNGYPEDVVEVYLNEAAAHKHRANMRKIALLDPENPDHQPILRKLIDETKALEVTIEKSRVEFHLRGIDSSRIEEAREIANDEFKGKYKQRKLANQSMQRYLPEEEQLNWMKYFNALVNSMYVVKAVDSEGREQAAPGVDVIYAFLEKGPESQRKKFLAAIADLKVSSAEFESHLDDSFFPKS